MYVIVVFFLFLELTIKESDFRNFLQVPKEFSYYNYDIRSIYTVYVYSDYYYISLQHITIINEVYVNYSGRIICITSARDDESLNSLSQIALNTIIQQNQKVSSSPPSGTSDSSTNTQ